MSFLTKALALDRRWIFLSIGAVPKGHMAVTRQAAGGPGYGS